MIGDLRVQSRDKVKKPERRSRLSNIVLWLLAILLLAPAVLVLIYGVVPPPITPLMVIRSWEGLPREYRWVPLSHIS